MNQPICLLFQYNEHRIGESKSTVLALKVKTILSSKFVKIYFRRSSSTRLNTVTLNVFFLVRNN